MAPSSRGAVADPARDRGDGQPVGRPGGEIDSAEGRAVRLPLITILQPEDPDSMYRVALPVAIRYWRCRLPGTVQFDIWRGLKEAL